MNVGDIRWGLWGRTVGPYGGGIRILTSLKGHFFQFFCKFLDPKWWTPKFWETTVAKIIQSNQSKNSLKLYKFAGGEGGILKKSVRWTITVVVLKIEWFGVDPHRIRGSIKIQGSHLNSLFKHAKTSATLRFRPKWNTRVGNNLQTHPTTNKQSFHIQNWHTITPIRTKREKCRKKCGRNAGELRGKCGRKCGRNAGEKVGENAGETAQEMS